MEEAQEEFKNGVGENKLGGPLKPALGMPAAS
jgi:hypothetical protein